MHAPELDSVCRLLDGNPSGGLVTTPPDASSGSPRVLHVNPTLLDRLGATPDQLLDRPLDSITIACAAAGSLIKSLEQAVLDAHALTVGTATSASGAGQDKAQKAEAWAHKGSNGKPLAYVAILRTNIAPNQTEIETLSLELARTQRRLENILDGTDAGTWEWDVTTDELTVNDRWLHHIGEDGNRSRIVTMDDWRRLVHPEDLPIADQRLVDHRDGRAPYYDIEFRMRHRDGHWVWILSRGKVTAHDQEGRPLRFCGTHLDVTSLRKAEARRRDEALKFSALFEGLNDAVFIHPLDRFADATFLDVNQVACERYHYDKQTLLGLSPATLRDPDASQTLCSNEIETRLRREGQLLYETRHRTASGETFPVEVSMRTFDYGGQQAVMSLVRDITARKRNEAAVLQSTTMFDRANDGIVVTDKDRRIISVNPAFERLTGYSQDEVIGRNPRFLSSGKHDEAFYRHMWGELASHGVWQGEIWNRKRNNELFLEWQTITAVENDAGETTNYISIFSDITKAKRSEEEVHYLSWHDPLTGLGNRRQVERELSQVLDAGQKVAVLYIDLDRFKGINESFGLSFGDNVLRRIAERLREQTREGTSLARFAADEFVVIKPVSDKQQAAALAQRLLNAFASPIHVDNSEILVTATIGLAVSPAQGTDGQALLRQAHSALIEAKQSGRNTFNFFTKATPSHTKEKILLGSGLTRALERDEFIVRYQPQVDLATGLVIGAEALVRWKPQGGEEISPGLFIPVAEETGLIVDLGAHVLNTACHMMAAINRASPRPLTIAVNLSGRQLLNDDILGIVTDALNASGLPPECLELEVTETFLVEQRGVTPLLKNLKQLGVRLSIDDFGTGHSSLARLKTLPIDKLKIDQAFVDGVGRDDNDTAIAKAVIALAKGLDLDVLAEGIETTQQRDFLIAEGCRSGQGFLYSPAVAADAFSTMLGCPDWM